MRQGVFLFLSIFLPNLAECGKIRQVAKSIKSDLLNKLKFMIVEKILSGITPEKIKKEVEKIK